MQRESQHRWRRQEASGSATRVGLPGTRQPAAPLASSGGIRLGYGHNAGSDQLILLLG